jgi:peroxiredoxin
MRRRFAILLGSLIFMTGIALGAMTRSTPRPPEPPRPAAARPGAVDAGTTGADLATIETAMKDLDLIRPSRQKLAEDFTLKTPEGGTFRLSEQRGKVVLVNFWATWCPPCKEEMPAMERLHARYKKNGFVMLAVSVDADPRVVPPFLKAHHFTFPVAYDPGMDVANTYGVRALPASFVVDREGHLAALAIGPRPWDNAASQALVEAMSR